MLKRFIERPVLSTVISIIIVILGVLGLVSLPVSQYPEIAPPTVVVTAAYNGANADAVIKSVITPLEEQINGVENMTYMSSTAANDGTATITVYFKLGVDVDIAAVNVQNRVSRATSLLPAEVIRAGVTTSKRQSSMVLIFDLYSTETAYDGTFLQNYAAINLIPDIKRIPGVGDATVFSSQDYSMRIWLRPDVMATYGLVPDDVNAALAEQNVEAAPGKFGENSSQAFQYVIKYKGRLKTAEDFENIIIRAQPNGDMLRLRDISRIEMGSLSYANKTVANGRPSIAVAVNQTAGSNARDLIRQVEGVLEKASAQFPRGIHYESLFNANDFLDASIEKVLHTLFEAFILVFIVVFLFLQDFRSTLIPAIAVPVAIIGTFFFLQLFGFTINLLTLFALVLAIGIVVDDAIVVVEAVHAKLDTGAGSAREATSQAMGEISGAIISITLVMSAVFLPVSFIAGSTGVFYKQFGLTLAISIVISAINALTLSPALCALLLKPHVSDERHRMRFTARFYMAFNVGFEKLTGRYKGAVNFFVRRKWVALAVIILSGICFWFLLRTTPTGFVPNEDQGFIIADITLPPASSLERTTVISDEVQRIARSLPEVASVVRVSGRSIIGGNGGSYGVVFIKLKPWESRAAKGQDIESLIGKMFALTSDIKGAKIIFFAPPTLQGFGNTDGFEMQLQDKTGGDILKLAEVSNKFLNALNQRPEIMFAFTAFNPRFPQYMADIDVARCKEAGVPVTSVLGTMQGYYGGVYASDFNRFGKQYRVMVQADTGYRSKEEGLDAIYVRNQKGQMAPVSAFLTLERVYGAESINRFNLFTAVAVTGAPKPGYSSGDAIRAVREVAAQTLPEGYTYDFSGLTREEMAGGNQTIFIFMLCIIFVYFLLSAQYESYLLPLAVLLSLPVGLAGAFAFARFFGVENNIYLQITLIMLIGLLAKNAILIVEFAVAGRKAGLSLMAAATGGAVARLRPIIMTSFAFILGLVPLMVASGAGAKGNRSIGTGAVGGMLFGTLLGVFIIPALFVVFQSLQERVTGDKMTDKMQQHASSAVIS